MLTKALENANPPTIPFSRGLILHWFTLCGRFGTCPWTEQIKRGNYIRGSKLSLLVPPLESFF